MTNLLTVESGIEAQQKARSMLSRETSRGRDGRRGEGQVMEGNLCHVQ